MPPVSGGFRGRRSDDVEAGRVPPGNYLTPDFPVLSAGPTPHDAIERWRLRPSMPKATAKEAASKPRRCRRRRRAAA
jgi:hypothetical protein